MSDIGKIIQKLRKIKKLSQNKLASLVGVSRGAIGNYEIGTTEPKYENYKALASVLGTTVNYLKHGEDSPRETIFSGSAPFTGSSSDFPTFPIETDSRYLVDSSIYQDNMYAIKSNTSEMYPLHKDGDILLCVYNNIESIDNSIMHYSYRGKCGVRRAKIDPESMSIVLVPHNIEEHEIIIIPNNDMQNLQLSRVVQRISNF